MSSTAAPPARDEYDRQSPGGADRRGERFEDICRAIEEYRRRTYLLYALQSIENLVKNGRVSRLAGSIAGILGIRVLGIASDAGTSSCSISSGAS
jgi:fatty acid-binding protein DegV